MRGNHARNWNLRFNLPSVWPKIASASFLLANHSVQFMKPKLKLFQAWMFCAVGMGIGPSFSLVPQCAQCGTAASAEAAPAETCIPWSKIGVPECGTGVDCQGGGLAVAPSAEGARLRCVFQLLEGEATHEGLWLTSTVIPPGGAGNERFRIVAAAVGRQS